jgi:hypothetical protein
VSHLMRSVGLALAIVGLFPAALAVGRWSSDAAPAPARLPTGVRAHPAAPGAATVESLATAVAARASFRRSRRPAAIAYDPAPSEASVSSEPVVPKPALVLTGIALGVRPVAVLEGLPGFEGPVVLAEGDTAAGLRIKRVRESGVVVMGYDTSWVLLLKEPWR